MADNLLQSGGDAEDILTKLGLHPDQLAAQEHLLGMVGAGGSDPEAEGDPTPANPEPKAPEPVSVPKEAKKEADPGSVPVPYADGLTPDTIKALSKPVTGGDAAAPALATRSLSKPIAPPSNWSPGEDRISKGHPFLGGVLKGLNLVGSVVAPGIMSAIPGTRENAGLARSSAAASAKGAADVAHTQAETGELDAKTDALRNPPGNIKEEQLLYDHNGTPIGYRDEHGKYFGPEDPNLPPGVKDVIGAASAKNNAPKFEKTESGAIIQMITDQKTGKVHGEVVYQGDPKVQTEITDSMVAGQPHKILVNKQTGALVKDLGAYKVPSTGGQDKSTARSDKSFQFSTGRLDKLGQPVEQAIQRMGRLEDALAQNTPQADALIAPELLSVMAGGSGSGLRMNEAEINRIVGGRSNWETLKASVNKWSLDPKEALSITPPQRQQIRALVSEVHKKLLAKQTILDKANDDLLGTDDPGDHRKIVADTKKQLSGIDQGAAQNSGAAETKVYQGVTYTKGADGQWHSQ